MELEKGGLFLYGNRLAGERDLEEWPKRLPVRDAGLMESQWGERLIWVLTNTGLEEKKKVDESQSPAVTRGFNVRGMKIGFLGWLKRRGRAAARYCPQRFTLRSSTQNKRWRV